ncbi:hypothetical protein EYF80_047005 [Liparis tanakae]|uniref:Uncharacterized protein n=1 Tax=Liparis tanakae TaxID=230148 RepID=A0A4Z2FPI1_9TELE|nr:hypothetical protein EYF80_047005 [Liparis tanakae]
MFPAPSWGPADSAMSRHPNQPSAPKRRRRRRKKKPLLLALRICVCAYQKISTKRMAKHIITYPWEEGCGGGDGPRDRLKRAGAEGTYLPEDLASADPQLKEVVARR